MTFDPTPAFGALLFVGVWALVSFIVAHVGGWRELAAIYRSMDPFDGKRWSSQSTRMRWGTAYNNIVGFEVNPTGLRLSVFFLFRLAHPPLFMPWTEITAANKRAWFRQWVELRFARVSDVPLVISKRLAERIAAEVGGAFAWTRPTE